MINANMRTYDYYTIKNKDSYGQDVLPAADATPDGQIKMSINITSQSVQDNINYENAQYMGLTLAPIDNSYVVSYGEEKLKVLYVNPQGRYKQVFLNRI